MKNIKYLFILSILFIFCLSAKSQCVSTNYYYLPDFSIYATDNGRLVSLRKEDWSYYNSITILGARKNLIKFRLALRKNGYKVITADGYNINVKGDASYGFYSNLIIITGYQGCYYKFPNFVESLVLNK